MMEQDMNMGRESEMLRSTGKNGQKRKSLVKQSCRESAANDHIVGLGRAAA